MSDAAKLLGDPWDFYEWQTCPKCGGQGHVSKPPYVAGDQSSWVSGSTSGFKCPVCQGVGMVVRP